MFSLGRSTSGAELGVEVLHRKQEVLEKDRLARPCRWKLYALWRAQNYFPYQGLPPILCGRWIARRRGNVCSPLERCNPRLPDGRDAPPWRWSKLVHNGFENVGSDREKKFRCNQIWVASDLYKEFHISYFVALSIKLAVLNFVSSSTTCSTPLMSSIMWSSDKSRLKMQVSLDWHTLNLCGASPWSWQTSQYFDIY